MGWVGYVDIFYVDISMTKFRSDFFFVEPWNIGQSDRVDDYIINIESQVCEVVQIDPTPHSVSQVEQRTEELQQCHASLASHWIMQNVWVETSEIEPAAVTELAPVDNF